jgi:hypothetical protein
LDEVHREKLCRIVALGVIAKAKGIEAVFPMALDGLRRYLEWSWMIAKAK